MFLYEVQQKFYLSNDIINHLKYIHFEIGKRYCFEFDALGNNGAYVHLFIGSEPKVFAFNSDVDYKKYIAINVFKEYSEIKKQLLDCKLWIDRG